ncbi:tol-pal system YbgF family protein [Bacteroidota bacterium]
MRKFGVIFILLVVFVSCNSKKKQVERQLAYGEIVDLKIKFDHSIQNQQIDFESAKILTEKYEAFIASYPKDTMAPRYLIELAMLNSGFLGETERAIENYHQLKKDYPRSQYVPISYFAIASIYSDKLKDFKNAEKYYRMLMDEFPNNSLAEQAEILIKYLGMSDEEMFEEIIENSSDSTILSGEAAQVE